MTMGQIDQRSNGWLYQPDQHKNKWRGKPRNIPLSPTAVEVIRPFVVIDPDQYLFRPCDRVAQFREEQRSKRKTRVQPSQQDRSHPDSTHGPGQCYTTGSYGRAIVKVCELNGLPRWTPGQLRKTAINEVAQKAGERHAKAFAGHADGEVTKRFYLEQDIALAQEAASLIEGK